MEGATFVRDDLVWDATTPIGSSVALRGSLCRSCGRVEFPALAACPACDGEIDHVPLGPDAVLSGFTEVLHPPPGALVDVPYTLAVAAFAENLSVLGLLDHHVPVAELEIGAPLEVCVVAFGGGATYGYRLR